MKHNHVWIIKLFKIISSPSDREWEQQTCQVLLKILIISRKKYKFIQNILYYLDSALKQTHEKFSALYKILNIKLCINITAIHSTSNMPFDRCYCCKQTWDSIFFLVNYLCVDTTKCNILIISIFQIWIWSTKCPWCPWGLRLLLVEGHSVESCGVCSHHSPHLWLSEQADCISLHLDVSACTVSTK